MRFGVSWNAMLCTMGHLWDERKNKCESNVIVYYICINVNLDTGSKTPGYVHVYRIEELAMKLC